MLTYFLLKPQVFTYITATIWYYRSESHSRQHWIGQKPVQDNSSIFQAIFTEENNCTFQLCILFLILAKFRSKLANRQTKSHKM